MDLKVNGNIQSNGIIGDNATQTIGTQSFGDISMVSNNTFNFEKNKEEILNDLNLFMKQLENIKLSGDNFTDLNIKKRELSSEIENINKNNTGILTQKVNEFVTTFKNVTQGFGDISSSTGKLIGIAGKIGSFIAGLQLM